MLIFGGKAYGGPRPPPPSVRCVRFHKCRINTININTDKTHQFYMNSKTLINFEFTDVDENTVIDVLRQLPLKSSFGFDGISSQLTHNVSGTL